MAMPALVHYVSAYADANNCNMPEKSKSVADVILSIKHKKWSIKSREKFFDADG